MIGYFSCCLLYTSLLVYRKSELINTLCQSQKRAFLLSYGYPVYHKTNVELYFDEILSYLAQRILSTKGFPHEIGIFPVSYTHLDVYKRQVMDNALQKQIIS